MRKLATLLMMVFALSAKAYTQRDLPVYDESPLGVGRYGQFALL